jgi:tyrosyl-tRNA synthetase
VKPPREQLEILRRNAVEIISEAELLSKIERSAASGKPLRVKAGFDPSSPDIHLGHTVLLKKLRQFQDLGHKVVFIIGDYTAMIGDPTGQTKTRPALSKAEVDANAKTYQDQAFRILDKSPSTIEVVHNSDWLGKLTLKHFLETIASRFTVARVLERDDFEKRMAAEQPITVREFMYPLLQAYDSVEVKADVELGGTDQKFNLLAGRDLQRNFGQAPQVVMTFPLLVGLDGVQKMSKSLGNTIAVNDSPKDIFGKAMSIPDALMEMYFNLLTDEKFDPSVHPRDAKVRLSKALTGSLCGSEAAEREAAEFDRVFSGRGAPSDAPLVELEPGERKIVRLIQECALADSANEAKRLVEQKAVTIDGAVVGDPQASVRVAREEKLLKVGKRRFARFRARA